MSTARHRSKPTGGIPHTGSTSWFVKVLSFAHLAKTRYSHVTATTAERISSRADAIALVESDAGQRVAKSAGARIPGAERHLPFKIARTNLVGREARIHRQHITGMRQLIIVLSQSLLPPGSVDRPSQCKNESITPGRYACDRILTA